MSVEGATMGCYRTWYGTNRLWYLSIEGRTTIQVQLCKENPFVILLLWDFIALIFFLAAFGPAHQP